MDGWTDGQTDRRSENNIPPNNFVVRGYNDINLAEVNQHQSTTNHKQAADNLQIFLFVIQFRLNVCNQSDAL